MAVVALGVSSMLLAEGTGDAQGKPPPPFALSRSENSPGTVTFSHDKHLAKGGTCSACHMRDFKMQRGASGPITLEAKQAGKFCGACHDGETTRNGTVVFSINQCDACHKD